MVEISRQDTLFNLDPTGSSATITIIDDDDANTPEESRISVAEVVVDAILDLPQFSVSGEPRTGSAPVVELPKVFSCGCFTGC